MGRHSFRIEVEDVKHISIFRLKKEGFLCGFRSGVMTWTHEFSGTKNSVGIDAKVFDDNKFLRIYYTQTETNGNKKDFDYRVNIVTTPCHFGGVRYWFICPLFKNGIYCGKRVGVLYKDGDYFGCRRCHNLSYQKQKISRSSRFCYLSRTYDLSQEAEDLKSHIKRTYYAGQPTKKYMKLLNIYKKLDHTLTLLERKKEI